MNHEESYFDGGLFQLIGYSILGTLITTATLGICLPWAYCMIYNWEIKHTVIEGRPSNLMVPLCSYLETG